MPSVSPAFGRGCQRSFNWEILAIILVIQAFSPHLAHAHRTKTADLRVMLQGEIVELELNLSAHDLVIALRISDDSQSPVTPRMIDSSAEDITTYITRGLRVATDREECATIRTDLNASNLPEKLLVEMTFRCPRGSTELRLNYHLLFHVDSEHRVVGQILDETSRDDFILESGFREIAHPIAVNSPSLVPKSFLSGVLQVFSRATHILLLLSLGLLRFNQKYYHVVALFLVPQIIGILALTVWSPSIPYWPIEGIVSIGIVLVSMDNLVRRTYIQPWKLTILVGFISGVGLYTSESDLFSEVVSSNWIASFMGAIVSQVIALIAALSVGAWMVAHKLSGAARVGSALVVGSALLWFGLDLFKLVG